ncbi:hypothetical protein C9374_010180 [Naegleria lovaniensis]|uniref:GPI transamidase component PIG-S n=1 Tax=Naegleria lovaniensis TaxID=51637 RepID=A0AA88GEP1_NAELO|nr:uncharacterized protein C9374_010180 [Naegleria lovaniensis]KAG2375176.1 hypothetical protein C9374_010180 [Naegleria lovaniensis]
MPPSSKTLLQSKRFKIIISFLVSVILGFAIWWFSTGVYQSLFPHDDIRKLLELDISSLHALILPIRLKVHILHRKGLNVDLQKEKFTSLKSDHIEGVEFWEYSSVLSINFGRNHSEHLHSVDDLLLKWSRTNEYYKPNSYNLFIILGDEKPSNHVLYLGQHRHAWIVADEPITTDFVLATSKLFYNILTNRNTSPNTKSYAIENNFEKKNEEYVFDDTDITVNKIASKYRITLTLVNMKPYKNYVFHWNSPDHYEKYIRSFTDRLSNLVDFVIDWKSILYGELPTKSGGLSSKQANLSILRNYQSFRTFERTDSTIPQNTTDMSVSDPKNTIQAYHEIEARSMQFLLNENNDWKFVSQDANETAIQLLLLIPPREYTPLMIKKYDGSLSEHNSYIIPRWGGVLVFNPSKSIYRGHSTDIRYFKDQDMQYIMELFSSQLRRLLSIPAPLPSTVFITEPGKGKTESKIHVMQIPSTLYGISQWEIDQLSRHRVQNNLLQATETLQAMSRVVHNMPNVYVMDVVAELTRQSIHAVEDAVSLCTIGIKREEDMTTLIHLSKTAIYNAQKAFSHESMLSMLHFPDAQKLAVYLPLILPILVTILVGLKRERNIIREKHKQD